MKVPLQFQVYIIFLNFLNISSVGETTKTLRNVPKSKKKNTKRDELTMSFNFLNLKNESLESKIKILKLKKSMVCYVTVTT